MNQALVVLRGVAKFHGERLVFKSLDLEIRPGRVLLVVGANGAGKTTLLKVMAGLSKPTAGVVEHPAGRGTLAFLGHQTFLYEDATARENLRFWTGLAGLDLSLRELDAVLEQVGLAAFADERAGNFSRGMAQRLNLARVFCLDPALVFLDEPDTGLDARSRAMLAAGIARFRDSGRAVVWVSHHVERDRALADDVLHLDRGRAAFLGPARDFDPAVLAGEAAC